MITSKQIQALYGHSYITYFATYFGAVLAYWLFKDITPDIIINTWFIGFTVFICIRVILTWQFKKREHIDDSETWLIVFLITSAISGTMWGLTGFIFIPKDSLSLLESVLHHGILLLFVATLIAGSIITYSASKSVYLSFSIPAIVPQCLMLIAQGDKYHSFLGGVVLVYAFIMFVISIYIHRVFLECDKIENENDYLKKLITRYGIELD